MKTPGGTWRGPSCGSHPCSTTQTRTITNFQAIPLAKLFFKQASSDVVMLRLCQWLGFVVILEERVLGGASTRTYKPRVADCAFTQHFLNSFCGGDTVLRADELRIWDHH